MTPVFDYKGIQFYIRTKRGDAYLCALLNTDQALRKDREQGFWIPCKHFKDNGLVLPEDENIDYVFRKIPNCLVFAGYHKSIVGIVRQQTIDTIKAKEFEKRSKLEVV